MDGPQLLDLLAAPADDPRRAPSAAVVVAHPDDEAVGAGGRLRRLRAATFVYITDGAPRNLHDAHNAGCATREAYAAARREERRAALALAGIGADQIRDMSFADQEASHHLAEVAEALVALLAELRPGIVLTHPYEGGHPDHDATAFAVHRACDVLGRRDSAPVIVEMASYHNRGGTLATGSFLPFPTPAERGVLLSPDEQKFKRQVFDCYGTQRRMLSQFPLETERFRIAPRYDFTRPPHEGTLFYEMFDWGMTGPRWRELAAAANRSR